jgi:hypothetical protein
MDAMLNRAYRNVIAPPIFVATHNERNRTMSNRFTRGISEFFDIVGSAVAVSAATREGRQARSSDLQRLGIDPQRFREIKRF